MSAAAVSPQTSPPENELVAAEKRLSDHNARLEHVIEDLEKLAFMVSHDLREPLRVIMNSADCLVRKMNNRADAEGALYAAYIMDSAARMSTMLSEFLEYSRLCAQPTPCFEVVDLNFVLENVKLNLKALINAAQAVVKSDRLPLFYGHASDLTSLFQNLIANAIHYHSDKPPTIHISVRQDGGALSFSVSDNGMGIDPAYHKDIFEPFKRLHPECISGTGLGLAICRRIIGRYGGQIWVESQPDQGATFMFTLPLNEHQG